VVPVADAVDVQRPNAEARKRGFERVQDVADIEKASLGFSSQDSPGHQRAALSSQQQSSSVRQEREDPFVEPDASSLQYRLAGLELPIQHSAIQRGAAAPHAVLLWLNGRPRTSMNFASTSHLVSTPERGLSHKAAWPSSFSAVAIAFLVGCSSVRLLSRLLASQAPKPKEKVKRYVCTSRCGARKELLASLEAAVCDPKARKVPASHCFCLPNARIYSERA
jgi:hypothetical protein